MGDSRNPAERASTLAAAIEAHYDTGPLDGLAWMIEQTILGALREATGAYPMPRNDGAGYTVDDRRNPDTDAYLAGEHDQPLLATPVADRARQGRRLAAHLGCLAIDAVRALDEAGGDEVRATEMLRRRMVMR